MTNKRYLLILPCSKQKKKLSSVCAADIYDGPFYKIIRKHRMDDIDILIISAKYGLINSVDLISYYDQKMTRKRAKEIARETKLRLERVLANNNYNEIFINLGKTYMLALDDCHEVIQGYNICWARGGIGERLHQLKSWLRSIRSEEVLTS